MTGPRTLRLPEWVDDVDERVDQAWELLRGQTVTDRVFYAASAAGDFSAIWHALNLVRVIRRPDRRADGVRLALALGAESLIVNQGLKRLFRRERPTADPAERPHHLRQPSTSSFPSGHASSAVVATSLLSEGSRWAPAYRAAGFVVATSRVHVRIHHASDVVAGAAVGLVLVRGLRRALR